MQNFRVRRHNKKVVKASLIKFEFLEPLIVIASFRRARLLLFVKTFLFRPLFAVLRFQYYVARPNSALFVLYALLSGRHRFRDQFSRQ